jgi:hypothetical protein
MRGNPIPAERTVLSGRRNFVISLFVFAEEIPLTGERV